MLEVLGTGEAEGCFGGVRRVSCRKVADDGVYVSGWLGGERQTKSVEVYVTKLVTCRQKRA